MRCSFTELSLLPVTERSHQAFLFQVFSATRSAALRSTGLPDAQVRQLMELQFRAQQQQYTAAYPAMETALVLKNGAPAGYWSVENGESMITLVDIALLPEKRGAGIGTALITELLSEGDRTGKPVCASVAADNPARRLYGRLGFATVGDDGVYVTLQRQPAART